MMNSDWPPTNEEAHIHVIKSILALGELGVKSNPDKLHVMKGLKPYLARKTCELARTYLGHMPICSTSCVSS